MTPGRWKDRADFERWWAANVIAFNRLAVTDPQEWERVARAVETFNQEHLARRIET